MQEIVVGRVGLSKNDHIHVPLMSLLIHDIETVFKELL